MESQSLPLWSMCNLTEDDDPQEVMLEETQYQMPDQEFAATSSLLQWTTLRPTRLGSLNSDLLFHSTQIFQMASSSPSTSIKSRISRSAISRSRPAPLPGHSLLRLTLPGNNPTLNLESYPSQSIKDTPGVSQQNLSGDSSGTPRKRISSIFSTKGMGRQTSRGSSSSRSS
ncbi:movement protein [peach-associated luteovirus 2]|nr:movement protein [peach-associated luteovirus 2]